MTFKISRIAAAGLAVVASASFADPVSPNVAPSA
jgi:hypothetical protein